MTKLQWQGFGERGSCPRKGWGSGESLSYLGHAPLFILCIFSHFIVSMGPCSRSFNYSHFPAEETKA